MKVSALRIWRKRITSEWKKYSEEIVLPAEYNRITTFAYYIYCALRYRFTFSEYFGQYKFYALGKRERSEYISLSQVHRVHRDLNKKVRDMFWYKDRFLRRFQAFVKREWINLHYVKPEDFVRFCEKHQKFILKPQAESCGNGIRLITIENVQEIAALYNRLSSKSYIAEEVITACDEIAAFHPDSLNTIRVVTYWNGRRFGVIGSFFRMGVKGSYVDNAQAGGIFARIDIKTGEVDTEGITITGERFISHPNSNKTIYGFKIPCWEDIIDTCRQAARSIPEAKVVGWDVAVRKDYAIVIIEGNHISDFDVMQSPAGQEVKNEVVKIVRS